MVRIKKREKQKIHYDYVFFKDNEQKVENVYQLIFEELENIPGVFSFKFKKDEKHK